jgi:hypothetical protein
VDVLRGVPPIDLLITSLMTNLGVHILPLAFPCTLAMIRKVATMIGPGQPRSLIRMAGLVYDLRGPLVLDAMRGRR